MSSCGTGKKQTCTTQTARRKNRSFDRVSIFGGKERGQPHPIGYILEALSFLFGKARTFFEAGVDSSVLDCFKKNLKADGSRKRSEPWSEGGGSRQLCWLLISTKPERNNAAKRNESALPRPNPLHIPLQGSTQLCQANGFRPSRKAHSAQGSHAKRLGGNIASLLPV